MLVKDLKSGMLLEPMDDSFFLHYYSQGVSCETTVEHIECYKISSYHPLSKYRRKKLSEPLARQYLVYLGVAPKKHAPPVEVYEYRHRVFVTALGREMRVASECWRNIQEVMGDKKA